jgi:hypothetical protein
VASQEIFRRDALIKELGSVMVKDEDGRTHLSPQALTHAYYRLRDVARMQPALNELRTLAEEQAATVDALRREARHLEAETGVGIEAEAAWKRRCEELAAEVAHREAVSEAVSAEETRHKPGPTRATAPPPKRLPMAWRVPVCAWVPAACSMARVTRSSVFCVSHGAC